MEFFFGSKTDLKSVSGLFFEAAVERKVVRSIHRFTFDLLTNY